MTPLVGPTSQASGWNAESVMTGWLGGGEPVTCMIAFLLLVAPPLPVMVRVTVKSAAVL